MWEKLIDKVKNQSTLIVIALFAYSYFALKGSTSLTNPLTITGFIAFGLGILLALGNFFINQFSESYKYVIEELKGLVTTLKLQQKFTDKRFRDYMTDSNRPQEEKFATKGYTSVQGDETESG